MVFVTTGLCEILEVVVCSCEQIAECNEHSEDDISIWTQGGPDSPLTQFGSANPP